MRQKWTFKSPPHLVTGRPIVKDERSVISPRDRHAAASSFPSNYEKAAVADCRPVQRKLRIRDHHPDNESDH
jgi:hypothetical protein